MIILVALTGLMLATPPDRVAAQSCPQAFAQYWECDALPPSQENEIEGDIGNSDDGWAGSFNSGSAQCVSLAEGYEDALEENRVWFTDDLEGSDEGMYYGSGDGNGHILLDDDAFGDPYDVDGARLALHEAAHDLGCTDDNNQAALWAAHCVDYDQSFSAPPQQFCGESFFD